MNATITFAEMTNNELRQFIEKKGLPKPKSAVRTKDQLIAHINTHWNPFNNLKKPEVVVKKPVCECCGASDKSVGLATGDNGVEMWVCRFCDVDGSNYNGWGEHHCSECGMEDGDCNCNNAEPNWGNIIATMMARTEFAVYEEDDGFEDCNDCGYAHHHEDKCPNETTCEHYEKSEKAEAEEEEDVCYGKHCDKKSCLKLATGWNRLWGGVAEKRFALNLYCDECIEQDCFEKCEACRVVYPVTSLNYRTGGLFGEHCGNNLYCEACCKDIEEKMTLREEPEPEPEPAPVAKITDTKIWRKKDGVRSKKAHTDGCPKVATYVIGASETDGADYHDFYYCYGDLKEALNAFNAQKKKKNSKEKNAYTYRRLILCEGEEEQKEVKVWQRTKEEIVRPTFQLAELNTFNFDYTLFKHERGGFCKYAVYNNTANHYVACDFDGDKIIGWGKGTIYKTLNAWTTANWKEQRIKDGNNKTTRNNAYRETKYIPLQIIDDDELIYGPLYEEIEWESSMSIEKK